MITQSAFDILLKDFFNGESDFSTIPTSRSPHPVDIYESKEGIHFEVACTGVQKEGIEVKVEEDVLRITYNKNSKNKEEDVKYLLRSIARRSFNLGYRLAGKYDLQALTAKYDSGLLHIAIPYKAQSKPKTITIQ